MTQTTPHAVSFQKSTNGSKRLSGTILAILVAGVTAVPLQRAAAQDRRSLRNQVFEEYFGPREVSFGFYGVGDFGHDQRQIEHTNTETILHHRRVLRDVPGFPGFSALDRSTRETITLHTFDTEGPFDDEDGGWGGGFDVTWYWPFFDTWSEIPPPDTWLTPPEFYWPGLDTWSELPPPDSWVEPPPRPRIVILRPQWGIGLEGEMLDGELFGRVTGKLLVRLPIESSKLHVAPYLFAGFGGEFSNDSKVIGFVGAGIEHRFTRNFGVFADGRWVFDGKYENVAEIHVGVRFAFGPQPEVTSKK